MSVVLVLFCLVNFVGSLTVDVQNAVMKELKGRTATLTWTITKSSGETIINGGINFVRPGSTSVSLAYITANKVLVISSFSDKGWSGLLTSQRLVLSKTNLKEEDDATYTLSLAYQSGGKLLSSSANIRLKVLVIPYYKAGTFTEGTVTSQEGNQVTLKCEPDGSPKPIKIIWRKSGVNVLITNTDKPNLVFKNVSRIHSGRYTCDAENDAGKAIKIPTTNLVIQYKPVNTKFNVTSVFVKGEPGTLKCTAEAYPKAAYTISGGGLVSRTLSSGIYLISIVHLTLHDNKKVECTPFNSIGNGRTAVLTLDVKVKPRIFIPLPAIMDAIEGKNFSITCSAAAKPPAVITWLKFGSPIRNSPPSYVVGRLSDSTFRSKATLKLGPVKRQDNGVYTCLAKNAYGQATDSVTLNLKYLPGVINKIEFKNRLVREGLRVELDCRADGNPKTTYYVWRWGNGTVIQNRTSGKLLFSNIKPNEGGRLSCAGHSSLGEGAKQYINLFVQVPPQIIIPPKLAISLNESERLILFCNASGVPKPVIRWRLKETILRATGERLIIDSVDHLDKGTYTCIASNGIEPNSTANSEVTIYYKPVIVSTSAADTIIGAESGAKVLMSCNADALPLANLTWLYFRSRLPVNETDKDVIEMEKIGNNVIQMVVKARIGERYWCYAINNRGNASQLYEIRPKGTPEAPILNLVRTSIYTKTGELSTVEAYVKWKPGYNGGQRVWYKISYGKRAEGFTNTGELNEPCNCATIKGLEANTDYVFFVRAHNNAGPSNTSNTVSRRTAAFYGKASVERFDKGKIVRVSFVVNPYVNLTRSVIRYREKQEISSWEYRTVSPIDLSKGSSVIEYLDPEILYEFQVMWYVGEMQQITAAGEVGVWNVPPVTEARHGLTRTEIIAIIAGVGGFLLIVILIVFLCLIRRRQKPKRDEAVVVMRRQPATNTVDIVTRRSLIGSVEDDPFVSAHYGSEEKKKGKTRDSYYMPGHEDLNTFSSDNNARHSINPAENSQAYQPYRFGKKTNYEDFSSDDDDDGGDGGDETLPYNGSRKPLPSDDDELSSEPGYARPEDVKGNNSRNNIDGPRERPHPNPNDVYSQVKKGNKSRPTTNGRGAPPPYRPRSTADPPQTLPPYHPDDDDTLDLDDPAAFPFDDVLPPPMPVLPTSRSVPEDMSNYHYPDHPMDTDSTLERSKSPSHTSLPGKPYINVHGKLVRPGSSGGLSGSSSEHFDDDERRSPEPETSPDRSRRSDSDDRNLVSYLV